MSSRGSKGRTQLPLCHFLIPIESPCMMIVSDQKGNNLSQRSTGLKLRTTSLKPRSHYIIEWSTFSHEWNTCYFVTSFVNLQDFYLQPFFFMLGFRQGKWKSILLGWVTERNFKGILSFPTFCCFWHKSWELDYLESSRTPQSTFPILSFQNILVFIIRYSQKGEGFINFFCKILQIWGDQEQNPCQTKS